MGAGLHATVLHSDVGDSAAPLSTVMEFLKNLFSRSMATLLNSLYESLRREARSLRYIQFLLIL
jgi:hypothetical protein